MNIQALVSADYEDLGLIGLGGMGEVRRVCDRRLNRLMAMKILRPEWSADAGAAARFVEEAQATAQLQHPGIVPVHEIGRLADGRIYFTMKEVQGRTLAQVIDDVHDQADHDRGGTSADGWSFRRLIDAFRAVCDAVAYAHSRGVVHRDLKPQNIMVGQFGEVLVLDWGLAMVVGRAAGVGAVHTVRSEDDALATSLGTVSGTPAYMPPEQARGHNERIGPASDVYSLGAILYQILAGRSPFPEGSADAVLQQVINGPPVPLHQLSVRTAVASRPPSAAETTVVAHNATAAGATIDLSSVLVHPRRQGARLPMPDELVAACQRAMAREPDERFANAAALALEIAAWIEGARRREQGLARVAQAQSLLPALAELEARAQFLLRQARERLEELKPWDTAEQKQPAWDLEDQAKQLSERVEVEESQVLRLLHAALSDAPDLSEAHAALASHYRRRHEQAEQEHDPDARRLESLLRSHDRGEHALWLAGDGALTLVTEPAGATVELYRYVERGRRRVAESAGILGQTPLLGVPLAKGDWLLVITAAGRATVRYPVSIGRLEHWDGVAPGQSQPRKVWLPALDALRAGEIYVPCGWYQRGGDAMASGSGRSERVWLDAFIINRFAVTNREYQAFLDALVAAGDLEQAQRCAPREQTGGPFVGSRDGLRFVLPESWPADGPVVDIDWWCADAYARWSGARLLGNDEWEKAARGVDGRMYPWGDGFDATFSRMRDSVQGLSSTTAVDSHPVDESPYGVRGMAGNACTWCAGGSPERRPYRGGAWAFHQASVRSACRFLADPSYRYFGLGVRIGRDLD